MKILLLGEFSGLHSNLRDGLVKLGHQVTIASNGDGWKNFASDIDLKNSRFSGLAGKIERGLRLFLGIKPWKYDVIQLITYKMAGPVNGLFLRWLRLWNRNVFVLEAGDSPLVIKYSLDNFNYSPYHISRHEINLCRNLIEIISKAQKKREIQREISSLKIFKKIIPTAYSYEAPFKGVVSNLSKTILMPINVERYSGRVSSDKKIKILYGENRRCDKGHFYIARALKRIEKEFKDVVVVDYVSRLPFQEYVRHVAECDILVDQCKSRWYGMNALMALSMGKVVFSGAEEFELNSLGIVNCPVVNIKPSVTDIYNKLSLFVKDRERLVSVGAASRIYAQKNHDCVFIAKKYVNAWGGIFKSSFLMNLD